MVLDVLRGYVQLVSGVTEEPRQRAAAAARSMLAQAGSAEASTSGQFQQQVAAVAEELVITSRANRELLLGLIRTEVERALGRLGIASADEVHALQRSVDRLERLIRSQQAAASEAGDKGAEPSVTSPTRSAGRRATGAAKKEQGRTTKAGATGAAARRAPATTADPPAEVRTRAAGAGSRARGTSQTAGRRRRAPAETRAEAEDDA
jgi:hypothetical protein